LNLPATPQGRLIDLRRAEVDLTEKRLRLYRRRHRDPKSQALVLDVPYQLPQRRFQECSECSVSCHLAHSYVFGMYGQLSGLLARGADTGRADTELVAPELLAGFRCIAFDGPVFVAVKPTAVTYT
jgi:hypothetical protein